MPKDPLTKFLKYRTRSAFEEVARTHGPRTLQAAYRVLGDRSLAEDAAQDVFVRLLDLRPPAGGLRSPAAFLTTMAVNAARKELRSRGRRVNHEQGAAEERREAEMSVAFTGDQVEAIREAVASLPDALKETVELRYFGSLTLEEVATALGVARRTVNARLKEARERLEGSLSDVVFSPVLAGVAGEMDGVFPETTFRPEVLSRLASSGGRLEAAAPSLRPKILGIGAVATVLAIAVFYLAGGPGGDAPYGAPDPVAGIVATGTTGPAENRGLDPDAASGTPTDRSAGDPSGTGLAGVAEASVNAAGDTGVIITVVDEQGELLSSGTIQIGLVDFFPPAAVQVALAPFKHLLMPQLLEDANPLRITGLPDLVDGMGLTIEVESAGRPPSERAEVKIEKGRTLEHRVAMLPPAGIEVTVTDRVTGRPIRGAAVVSESELRRRGTKATEATGTVAPGAAITDEAGRCTVTGLRPGEHDIAVSAGGYRGVGYEAVSTGSDLPAALEPIGLAGAVLVRVSDPAGDPLKGLRVELDLEGESTKRVATTDREGRCRYDGVPPGYHRVTLLFDDWFELLRTRKWLDTDGSVMSATVVIKADEVASARLGFLRGSALLTGTVVGPDGEPVGSVEVSLGGTIHRTATSDAHGRVRFSDLPDGKYRLSVENGEERWDWSLTEEWVLAEGEVKDCRIPLGTATIRGRVLLPGGGVPGRRLMLTVLGPAFAMGNTNQEGEFEFRGVPPGTYSIGVATRDFATPETKVTVDADGPKEAITVELLRGGRLLIDFAAEDHARLLSARLTLLDPAGEELNLDRDESGKHDRVTGPLRPGEYSLRIVYSSGESRVVKFAIEDGKDTPANLGR